MTTPSQPRTTRPFAMSCAITALASLIGIEKPTPCPAATMAVLMPMTLPSRFSRGPPELPIDRGVGLDEVLVRGHADAVARGRGTDAAGDRAVQPERIADG